MFVVLVEFNFMAAISWTLFDHIDMLMKKKEFFSDINFWKQVFPKY
jgi:hypothetical protein